MRRIPHLALVAAAGSLAVTGTLAYGQGVQDRVILSSEEGALLPPEHWDCSLYVKEYRDFIELGNDPENWRFAGKRYRSVGDGETYDWRSWLEWYEEADCGKPETPELASDAADSATKASGGTGGGNSSALAIVGGLGLAGALAAMAGGGGGGESEPKEGQSGGGGNPNDPTNEGGDNSKSPG